MTRLIAKVCGLTNEEDLARAQAAQADLLGFVFHPASVRHCSALLSLAPLAGDQGVLVMVAEDATQILQVLAQTPLKRVQPYLPLATRAYAVAQLRQQNYQVLLPWYDMPDQPNIAAELYVWETAPVQPGVHGGTGQTHLAAYPPPGPYLLAGGLDAQNLVERTEAVPQHVRNGLRGFDASSRLESSPGRKDIHRLNSFVRQVHSYAV